MTIHQETTNRIDAAMAKYTTALRSELTRDTADPEWEEGDARRSACTSRAETDLSIAISESIEARITAALSERLANFSPRPVRRG